ncbi:MAG: Sensor protein FixL [Steroidobacteraceae bacterium]|nr:Sensor protein FixL [Steroidobacteraceae bacterium]
MICHHDDRDDRDLVHAEAPEFAGDSGTGPVKSPSPDPQNDGAALLLLERLLLLARRSALESMGSGIAHELNQPIGAITTFAHAGRRMLDRPEPMIASAIEALQHTSEQALIAGRGIGYIRELLRAREMVRSACEPAEIVMELMPVLQLLAGRRGSNLELSLQPDLPTVSIDRLRIQYVLYALTQNALEAQAGFAAAPVVRIGLTGNGYGVRIAVEDQGPGVPETARARLFHPFFTTKPHGTGLDLASGRAIIEAHEGTIGFENLPAGGARFWFRLPASAAA